MWVPFTFLLLFNKLEVLSERQKLSLLFASRQSLGRNHASLWLISTSVFRDWWGLSVCPAFFM